MLKIDIHFYRFIFHIIEMFQQINNSHLMEVDILEIEKGRSPYAHVVPFPIIEQCLNNLHLHERI